MKRPLRVIVDVVAVVSLLLAVAVLWVSGHAGRGHVWHYRWSAGNGRGVIRWYGIQPGAGGIAIDRAAVAPAVRPDAGCSPRSRCFRRSAPSRSFAGSAAIDVSAPDVHGG